MKSNWSSRVKNVYFWCGLIGIIMVQLGISDVHSWIEVLNVLFDIVRDPARLLSTIMMLAGIWVDPTTSGFSDREKLEDKTEK